MNIGWALALISTRQQYDHLFHIYLPIAIGVFAFIVLRHGARGPDLPPPAARARRALA